MYKKNRILGRIFQIYFPHFYHEQRKKLNKKKKSQGISDQPKWQEKVLLSHDSMLLSWDSISISDSISSHKT